jgi:predicted small secreted protein
MTGLQEAFYIVALIYMGISLIIIFGILATIVIIRQKVISLENMVKEKLDAVFSMGEAAGEVIQTVKKLTHRKDK